MRPRAELALAGAVAALGVALAAGAHRMSAGFGYDRIGPRTAPFAVALGLVLLGAALAASAVRLPRAAAPAAATPPSGRPLGYLALAGLSFLVLAGPLGFIPAASLQFWLVARAFSGSRPLRDAAAALLLSVVVYLAFSRGLGLSLPAGFAGTLGH